MAEHVRPKDVEAVIVDVVRPKDAWARQAEKLSDGGLVGAALLAEVRAVGNGEPAARLEGWLREKVQPKAGDEPTRTTDEALAAVAKMKRFDDASTEKMIARLLDGVLAGGRASVLFREAASVLHDMGDDVAAFDVVRGARAIAAKDDPARVTTDILLVTLLFERGRWAEARDVLADVPAPQRTSLATRLAVLSQAFAFRAADYLSGDPDDDAKVSPLSLEDAQAGVRSMARRIDDVRALLAADASDASWLPNVDALLANTGKALPDNDSELPEGFTDRVFVLRNEWNRLSWALAALGATKVVMPIAIVRPRCAMDFVDDFMAARHDLLCDLAEGNAPKAETELDQQILGATWGGTPLRDLDADLARLWADETEAGLAGLRWALGQTPSPWSAEP
ncbi:hypothetical protein [Labilithrix luteola]|nr:hypothetical protein [Labilithrix luteola]